MIHIEKSYGVRQFVGAGSERQKHLTAALPKWSDSFMAERCQYAVYGILFVLLGGFGYSHSIGTLGWGILAAIVILISSMVLRRPRSVRLIDIWFLGFIYLYSGDLLLFGESLQKEFGDSIMVQTEAFTLASFGAALLGYGTCVRYRNASVLANSPSETQPPQSEDKERLPFGPLVAWVFLCLFALMYIFVVITPGQLLYVARGQRTLTVSLGLINIFMGPSLVSLPVLTAYLMSRYRMPIALKIPALLMITLCISACYLEGTRFLLGFAMSGVILIVFRGLQDISKKQVFALVVCAFLIAATQSLMALTRMEGERKIEAMRESSAVEVSEKFLSAEGVLRITAFILQKRPYDDPERPIENLFIFIWWIPRSIWPDKPTMAGYWFLRNYTKEKGFSEGYSVSGGFAMPALLDFGPLGGVFFTVLYGVGLALLERFVEKHKFPLTPLSAMAGVCYFGAMFMIRSLHTSLIAMMMIGLTVLPFILLDKPKKPGLIS